MGNMHCQLIEKTLKGTLVTKSQNRQISHCNVYTVFPRSPRRNSDNLHVGSAVSIGY